MKNSRYPFGRSTRAREELLPSIPAGRVDKIVRMVDDTQAELEKHGHGFAGHFVD